MFRKTVLELIAEINWEALLEMEDFLMAFAMVVLKS